MPNATHRQKACTTTPEGGGGKAASANPKRYGRSQNSAKPRRLFWQRGFEIHLPLHPSASGIAAIAAGETYFPAAALRPARRPNDMAIEWLAPATVTG